MIQTAACTQHGSLKREVSLIELSREEGGVVEHSLHYVFFDEWKDNSKKGRFIKLDDMQRIGYKDVGAGRKNIVDLTAQFADGNAHLKLPSTSIQMVKRPQSQQPKMIKEVLDYVSFLEDCMGPIGDGGDDDGADAIDLADDPCCICNRLVAGAEGPGPSGPANARRCPMCKISFHAECARDAFHRSDPNPVQCVEMVKEYTVEQMED
eukprot:3092980-Pyramimonas_sp.AAC.1